MIATWQSWYVSMLQAFVGQHKTGNVLFPDAIPEGAPASLVAREVSACGTYFNSTPNSSSYGGAAVIDGAALTPLFGSSVSQKRRWVRFSCFFCCEMQSMAELRPLLREGFSPWTACS